ncbi:hypothetical protein VFPPC_18444 [Pochonia chlamydosporia 170]|uniref:Uncharacterized protein n=1 Tax=Pochonia chlamydosporia 170 TaxID=1380566 RepID=A0A219ANZ5_METCM|nr:hypothetical protein VFPPC_18444 [Pochonia chlamydosporia 170]OWT42473.1 hypothetical protein VFPPC_18444 [Pochonia chlamydosporia 170]
MKRPPGRQSRNQTSAKSSLQTIRTKRSHAWEGIVCLFSTEVSRRRGERLGFCLIFWVRGRSVAGNGLAYLFKFTATGLMT